jgi:hypothetical protein
MSLGYVRLGWKYSREDLFRFRFYSSHWIYRRRMRTYHHTVFIVLDRYDILYGGLKSDTGVGVDFYIDMALSIHFLILITRNLPVYYLTRG